MGLALRSRVGEYGKAKSLGLARSGSVTVRVGDTVRLRVWV